MATPQQRKPAPAPAKAANKPQAPARPAAPAQRPQAPAQQAPKPQTTAVTTARQTALAPQADVPDYIRQGQARGSENVGTNDLVIPRIELVQALSKCLKEGSAEYIEGAKPGMLYNSVTRDLFGAGVTVCPVFFKKQYLGWQDINKGGGFCGAYDTLEECNDQIAQQENPENWEAVETHQQIVLVVNMETGAMDEAVLSCAKTKQKVSRQWNSLIRNLGFDRFSRLYDVFGVDEQNNAGQDYKNIAIRPLGFAPVEVYKRAEDLYNKIASGELKFKVDETYDGMDPIDGQAAPAGDPNEKPEY